MNADMDSIIKSCGTSEKPTVAMYSPAITGGMRKYVCQLVNHLQTRCLVVTANIGPEFPDHWQAPILDWDLKPHTTLLDWGRLAWRHMHNLLCFVNVARNYNTPVVHLQVFDWFTLSLVWPLLKREFKIVLSVHDVLPHKMYPGVLARMQKLQLKKLYRQADALCVFSRYGAGRLITDMGVDPTKVHVIPLGLNEPLPLYPPVRNQCPKNPIYLLFGSYRPNRGVYELVEAFLLLRKSGKPGTLRIAGKYPNSIISDIQELVALTPFANSLELINGFIPETEIDKLMRSSDVAVLPYTHFESQSGVIFLDYAYNLPIVASRVGGLAEMIEIDKTGILVEPGNIADLAIGLSMVITEWDHIIQATPARLLERKYSWERLAALTDECYTNLIE